MEKIAIISSLPMEKLQEKLPTTLSTYTLLSINENDDPNSFPINWSTFMKLTEFDKIIIVGALSSNDHMIQGDPIHFVEMLLLILKEASTTLHKKVFILHDKKLVSFESMTDLQLVVFGQSLKCHPSTLMNRRNKSVSSIQKSPTPSSLTAGAWASHYLKWLNAFTKGIVLVKEIGPEAQFLVKGIRYPLLVLEKSEQPPSDHITELKIKGGFLNRERSQKTPKGRFWFITSPDNAFLYTSLVHFKPSLPWFLYRLSQGWIHGVVMAQFARHVQKDMNK